MKLLCNLAYFIYISATMNLWLLSLVAINAKCSFAENQLDLVSKYRCYVERTVIPITCLMSRFIKQIKE